jgi:hypothetical protein
VVGCDAETAAEAWAVFDFRQEIGTGLTTTRPADDPLIDQEADEERVSFQERPDGTSLVTLTVVYDEDEVDDVSSLRAEVDDELARYRESIERDAA